MEQENHGSWADSSGTRLRELQSSCAHLDPLRRRDYLREELRKAVAELPSDQQLDGLAELLDRFPDDSSEAAAPPPGSAPEQALDQLCMTLASLSGEQRESFAARASRLLDGETSGEPAAPAADEELAPLLSHDPGQLPHLRLALTVLRSGKLDIRSPGALDLLNLVKTAALLIDGFSGIAPVFWKIWAAAAPKSGRREPFEDGFLGQTARLLEGEPDASFADYSRAVSETSRLLVATLSAIPAALERTAGRWLDEFAPERIAAEVRNAERGPLGGQPEQRFWREYEYRCADFTPTKLTEEFLRNLSEAADAMVSPSHGASTS